MKNNLLRICLSVMLVVFVTSCNKNATEPTDSQNAEKYFPLEVGNYWIYRTTGGANDGLLDTMTVIGTKTIEGKEYFAVQVKYPLLITSLIRYMRNDNNLTIIREYIREGLSTDKNVEVDMVEMNFSLKPNEGYPQNPVWSDFYKTGPYLEMILSDTTFKTDAGRFTNCKLARRYMTVHLETNFVTSYAPSVGIVYESYPALSNQMSVNFYRNLVSAFVGGKHYPV